MHPDSVWVNKYIEKTYAQNDGCECKIPHGQVFGTRALISFSFEIADNYINYVSVFNITGLFSYIVSWKRLKFLSVCAVLMYALVE